MRQAVLGAYKVWGTGGTCPSRGTVQPNRVRLGLRIVKHPRLQFRDDGSPGGARLVFLVLALLLSRGESRQAMQGATVFTEK